MAICLAEILASSGLTALYCHVWILMDDDISLCCIYYIAGHLLRLPLAFFASVKVDLFQVCVIAEERL